ncbi:hypothetical protein B0H66DRAFT_569035 [Apodospora peruviana]|uniref:F-box domain-containing protein n=1 Tax=Apodospora peruviana TaxID=516989 RepID=A0AAE0HUC9_9PEZI|nr:hypothetical protein B0H66DRAFT_569035 [Apodospora peruviana]
MAGFSSQPDEGYSEDPLNPLSTSASFVFKPREDAISALGAARPGAEFPAWLMQHISSLSLSDKTELAMALLSDLPTSIISQIVEELNPRLYIDFVRYLPPEVCLKILGFLDPVSLINVARACRAWYDLALDRKLWEQLYLMEGWRAKMDEIQAAEHKVNEATSSYSSQLQRTQSEEDGHAHKKRVVSVSPAPDADVDMVMIDADSTLKQEPADMEMEGFSIFGDPTLAPSRVKTGISQKMSDLDMRSSASMSSKGKSLDKGKGVSPPARTTAPGTKDDLSQKGYALTKSTLWAWDGISKQYRINWKYLYTMRRKLESNWELGKFSNFQLPHPDHPEEGHGECIYSLQYNPTYLVSGSRDRTLKIWDMKTRRCIRTLAKHRGSVLCLQFDSDPEEDIIVSGSSDSDIIIWKFSTGKEIQTLRHAHRESVLNVKFDKRILVTCSKDKTIKIFNRRPLRYGDLGYQEVDPVPRNIKNYGYSMNINPDDLPQTPPWTMIGCLEGHGAAVNAVQIHDREIVSASGDRHIKVWDWPTQACTRTFVGHNKGIACVQYDGRRIVSGSSDNEVKVFDRQTGLEVASLRSHSSLVRTVQAGFGDLPYSVEDDAAEARRVDAEYFKALESGRLEEKDRQRQGRRQGNAGSRRPEDICAYGAKLPPGGGGGKYGRIVSGSYDTSIIIWRRDKEGIWKDQHHLKQEEAAAAAMRQGRTQLGVPGEIPLHPSMRRAPLVPPPGGQPGGAPSSATPSAPHQAGTLPATSTQSGTSPRNGSSSAPLATTSGPSAPPPAPTLAPLSDNPMSAILSPAAVEHYQSIIDQAVQGGQQTFTRALAHYPPILSLRVYVEAAIDSQSSPVVRSQLRQAFSAALIRAQFEQARHRREAMRAQENMAAAAGAAAAGSSNTSTTQPNTAAGGEAAGSSTARPTPAAAQYVPQASTTAHMATATAAAAAAAHQAHAQLHHAPDQGVHLHQVPVPALSLPPLSPVIPAPAAPQHHPHHAGGVDGGAAHNVPHHAPAEAHDTANPARVFKLQYDARRIICCSQTSVIVGWDFCNGDAELEEASRFFGTVV